MEPFDSYAVLPTPPRAGSQGRRHVPPVWWRTMDETSFSVRGLNERPDDESLARDDTMGNMVQQEHSAHYEASDPPTFADETEHDPAKSANRLRRRPAVYSLSKQYRESGKCSGPESQEAGAVQQQTIRPTVATQDDTDRMNNRASRHLPLSTGTNQPAKIKISSGSRGASAQTAAASNVAGVCEDTICSGDQYNGHQTDYSIGPDAEDTGSNSSIASQENASIRAVGNVRANIGPLQHSEAPNLSPQQAEFLNINPSSIRHKSLHLFRPDLCSLRNHTEEQSQLGHIKSFRAKFDNKLLASAIEKHQSRKQAAMRAEAGPRQGWSGHDDDLVKVAASYHWGDQSSPEKWLLDADNMLSQRAVAPEQGHGANGRRPLHQRPPVVPRSPGERSHRRDVVLGRAQAVKMSKPGEARLVSLAAKKSRSFNINCMSSEEADLMTWAGAVARSLRRSSTWTDHEVSLKRTSPGIEAAGETAFPHKRCQRPLGPRAMPGAADGTAGLFEGVVGRGSGISSRDVRFRQLVRRLEVNSPEHTRGPGHPPVQEVARRSARQGPASDQQSEIPIIHGEGLVRRHRFSALQLEQGHFSVKDSRQRQGPTKDGPMLVSPSKDPENAKPHPRDSGCPSLITDDEGEPTDSPGDQAYEYARAQLFQEPHNISGWETDEDASTVAPQEAPSKSSCTLFSTTTDENEIHADENTINNNGCGRQYTETRAVTKPLSFPCGNLPSHLRERLGGDRATGRQPSELTLFANCAILRWLLCTTDAPGTHGMHDESANWWQLLDLTPDDYQLRYGDEARAEILRTLRSLSGAETPRHGPSQEMQALLGEILSGP